MIKQLLQVIEYPEYEIITVNDGSSDKTLDHLVNLSNKYKKIRVCNIENNLGKAHTLIQGSLFSKGEFLLCLDADAIINKNAIDKMVNNFIGKNNKDLGAVRPSNCKESKKIHWENSNS